MNQKPVIYIDGKEGTTGLQIFERLGAREDIQLLLIDENKRKDTAERKKLINAADLVFLCLPDAAAREAVTLVENPDTRIIDASTAHRTNPAWDYGFPELSQQHRAAIVQSKRVANPGCHATGFIASVAPLVARGLIAKEERLSCYSLTGYSGGGKKMIAQYEGADKEQALYAPRIYGLTLAHKHIPEMQTVCGLTHAPIFNPIVDDYYKGMATTVPLFLSAKQVHEALCAQYDGAKLVSVAPLGYTEPMIAANTKAGSDTLTLIVCGDEEKCTVTALFDNLGKGASGAAVQNMNLMLGFAETEGLQV